MGHALRWAARNGPAVVIAGVLIGLVFPPLAALARPCLPYCVFIFTLGSFLRLEVEASRHEFAGFRETALMVLWTTFGMPFVVAALLHWTRPEPQLAQGLLMWALVPASPTCVAFAAILRLNIPIALVATLFGAAVSPFCLPAFAALLGDFAVTIDPFSTCLRLTALIGGAFVAATLIKRFDADVVRRNPEAMTGLAVCAMFVAGLGSMRGMQAHLILQPLTSLGCVALAYALLFGAEFAGTLLFWGYGRRSALTAGLITGTRTVTLAWVAMGDHVFPLADLFLAACMVAKYTAPGLTKAVLMRILEPKRAAVAAS
jgi:predicted Na+-dependent transporter